MKKNILSIIFFLWLPYSLFAGSVGGTGGSTEVTQILNKIQLVGIQATNVAQKILQGQINLKEYGLDPAVSALANMLLQQFQKDTIAWIKGGFQGGGPAFIVNPNAYFKNIANQQINIQLKTIQSNGNLFSNSVIGSVIQGVRGDRSAAGAQLTYTLGTTIQGSLCNEANIAQMAREAVGGGLAVGGSEADRLDDQIEAKKKELRANLCNKNPAKDVALQKTLASCFSQNFNCGGWNAWLGMTTNANNTGFGQAINASQIVSKIVGDKTTLAKGELVNGVMPKKKCTKWGNTFDDDGNPLGSAAPEGATDAEKALYATGASITGDGNAICLEEEAEVPATAIVSQLESAQKTGVSRVEGVHEIGELGSMITSILKGIAGAGIKSLYTRSGNTNGLNSSQVGTISIGSDGSVNSTNTGSAESATSTYTSSDSSNSTSLDEDGRKALDTLKQSIANDITVITDTRRIIDNTTAIVRGYEGGINTLETCYNEIRAKNAAYENSAEVVSGRAYIADRKQTIFSNINELGSASDQIRLSSVLSSLQGYLILLTNSQTVETFISIGDKYAKDKQSGNVFDETKKNEAQTKFDEIKTRIDTDTGENLNPKTQSCNQLRAQVLSGSN